MSDIYIARPSEIEYNAFPNGRRFREVEVYRRVMSDEPVRNQTYRCRMYQDAAQWQVFNMNIRDFISPGSRIYKRVIKAINDWDTGPGA